MSDSIEAAAKVIDPLAFAEQGTCPPRGWEHSTPKDVARMLERRKSHALSVAKRIIAAYRDSEIETLRAQVAELEARCAKYKADSTRLDKLQESFIKGEEFHIVMCEGKNEDEQCEHDTHPHFEAFDWSWRGEPVRASTLRGVIDKALTEGGEHG